MLLTGFLFMACSACFLKIRDHLTSGDNTRSIGLSVISVDDDGEEEGEEE